MRIARHLTAGMALILVSSLLLPAALRADDNDGPLRAWEYEVKAAFVYNFVKFVKWPNGVHERTDPIEVVILGRDPFGVRIDQALASKTVHGRSIRVRKARSLHEIEDCEVLFLTRQMEEHAAVVLRAMQGKPVLTISDLPGVTELGAVITMSVEDRRVRFDVNLLAAKRNGLTLSSHLLRLARRLEPQEARR